MSKTLEKNKLNVEKLNQDIKLFPMIFPITPEMKVTHSGVSQMVMLDRYSQKDLAKLTFGVGDFVVLTTKEDPKFPARGLGYVLNVDWENNQATVQVEEEYRSNLKEHEIETGIIVRKLDVIEKPMEVFWEQIAKRVATGLASVESTEAKREASFRLFYPKLMEKKFIPAGRVLYGAGSGTETTFFNCFVMPYPADSRDGLSEHRKEVLEIMSRGGGVGTNGSTIRPRHALARGVNGKSSGSVSWLNDLAQLTHLVEQGGSRRGAQMIMMADWHPDIVEFIISKMQNPKILRFLVETTNDEQIRQMAEEKLNYKPLTNEEEEMYQKVGENPALFSAQTVAKAKEKLKDGGTYQVNDPEFLSGANISVCISKEFMEAVENDGLYELKFPDVENYDKETMVAYNEKWHEVGDVREWEMLGYGVKPYRKIKAKELWNLINICATYAAEPGIFYLDTANEATNAKAYGQKVVATNPCGEQPLAPYSVCNLAAVNLAEMANKADKTVDWEQLKETVKVGVRLQDNVITATPYFLKKNKDQALGERRVGLGVMGLADLLIYCEKEYGSKEGNALVDEIFKTIVTAAYEESIELGKERGSFPFLVGETMEKTLALRNAFINSGFMKKMPEHIRQGVLENGIRNSHLLTVAPTGSTGTMVGVSTGLEPYYSFSYYRSGRLGKYIEVNAEIVQEYLNNNPGSTKENLPSYFVSAMELSPEAHVDVQCVIQKWVDSSLSKTVNAPKGYTVSQVQGVYERLYQGGAKGGTCYVDGSRDAQVLTLSNEENSSERVDIEVTVISEQPKVKTHDEVEFGSEVGDICPVCRKGTVEDIGGCSTCTNCNAQLKCGL